jgi:transposase-like protein
VPRTTNAIERLHEEFKLQIKTQAGLPSAENYAVLGLTCLGLCRSSLTSR